MLHTPKHLFCYRYIESQHVTVGDMLKRHSRSNWLRVYENFSIQGYEEWSFISRMFLQAHHVLMWKLLRTTLTISSMLRPLLFKELLLMRPLMQRSSKTSRLHNWGKERRKEASHENFKKWLISSTIDRCEIYLLF